MGQEKLRLAGVLCPRGGSHRSGLLAGEPELPTSLKWQAVGTGRLLPHRVITAVLVQHF